MKAKKELEIYKFTWFRYHIKDLKRYNLNERKRLIKEGHRI